MSRDVYAQQIARQNEGLPCEYCSAHSGHFGFCTLLNGGPKNLPIGISIQLGTERDAPVLALTADDRKWLAGVRVTL